MDSVLHNAKSRRVYKFPKKINYCIVGSSNKISAKRIAPNAKIFNGKSSHKICLERAKPYIRRWCMVV